MPPAKMARSHYRNPDGLGISNNATGFEHAPKALNEHDAESDSGWSTKAFDNAAFTDETFEPAKLADSVSVTTVQTNLVAGSSSEIMPHDPLIADIMEFIIELQGRNPDAIAKILAPVLIFVVGKESSQLSVKLALARRHSPVIDVRFGNLSSMEFIHLEDTTVEAVNLLVYYFENAKLEISRPGEDDNNMSVEDKKNVCDQYDMNLVHLYILAAKFGIPKLQNWVIWSLDKLHEKGVPISPATIPIIYNFKNPEKITNLRALLIHQYTWGRTWELSIDVFPTEMVFDMMSKMHNRFTKKAVLENYRVEVQDYYLPMDH